MPTGVCALTRTVGSLVKCHIIPIALTRPETSGFPLIQHSAQSRPIRRWSSWYDPNLVSNKGESILAEIDDRAISILRKYKLVWSGWPAICQSVMDDAGILPQFSILKIHEAANLRRFFHSLLWRSSETKLMEFTHIKLQKSDREVLRSAVLGEIDCPIDFFPITLIQIGTRGKIHNYTPIVDTKVIPSLGGLSERRIEIVRFYFDGLVAHIHLHNCDDGYSESIKPLLIAGSDELFVTKVHWKDSAQIKFLWEAVSGSIKNFGIKFMSD